VTKSLAESLQYTLLELCAIPSFIGEEEALCTAIEARLLRALPSKSVIRSGHSLIVGVNPGSTGPRIALAGHLDTVRTQHDGPARVDGSKLYGCGASDMKSGLALMVELAERLEPEKLPCNLLLIFYEAEEGPYEKNSLGRLLLEFPELTNLDLAMCLEPSDNKMQLGCMGSMHATARFHGQTAHSARPWQGKNAIYAALPTLTHLSKLEPQAFEIDGLVYREVISPTLAQGGRGRNVVPDLFEVNLNYRFAPRYNIEQAVEALKSHLDLTQAELDVTDVAPAGRPHFSHRHPRLRQRGVVELERRHKQRNRPHGRTRRGTTTRPEHHRREQR